MLSVGLQLSSNIEDWFKNLEMACPPQNINGNILEPLLDKTGMTGPHIMCLGQRSGLFSDCCAWSSAYCTASRRVCLKVLVLYLLKMHMNAFCVIYGSLLTPRAIPYCHLRWRIGLPDTSHRVLFCVVQIIHLGNVLFKSFRTPHHLRSLGYVFKALSSLLVATVYCC